MIPDDYTIRRQGEKVYEVLFPLLSGTFEEIQALCKIRSHELCFALMFLLKENRIIQEFADGKVYYKINFLQHRTGQYGQ